MDKWKRMQGLVFQSFVFMFLFFLSQNAHADTLTLTTYYPSPSGDYQDLRVMGNLGVGTANPATNLDVAGTFRMKPKTGVVSGWAAGIEGQMAYSSDDHKMYYYNGTNWVASGGGPTVSSYVQTPNFTTWSTAFVDITGMNQDLTFLGGDVFILFECILDVGGATPLSSEVNLKIDGVTVDRGFVYVNPQRGPAVCLTWAGSLTAGTHNIKVQYKVEAGANAIGNNARLTVIKF